MHVRFAATTTARNAIESGDLEQARAAGRMIEALAEPDILPEWQPYVANVRRAAADLVGAGDLSVAARKLATVGERCADCHISSKSRIRLGTSTGPTGGQHLEGDMGTHHWAAGRMWDALLVSSESTWLAGAEALESARLTIVAEGEVPGHELGIAEDVARVRLLARRAARARTNHERAEIYGELLSTCVSCHHAIRDR
jgi:cytochrome c556